MHPFSTQTSQEKNMILTYTKNNDIFKVKSHNCKYDYS